VAPLFQDLYLAAEVPFLFMDSCYQSITDEMSDGGSQAVTTDVATLIRLFLCFCGYFWAFQPIGQSF
jgi:hypothetical protein